MLRNTYTIQENSLSVLEFGEKNRPVVLLLHGIPASAALWQPVAAKLAHEGYYCLAPDLPGYGGTEVKRRQTYTLPGAASLLLEWLKQEKFQEIWLIGHDIGGGIAQLMLTMQESLFSKVTLSNAITASSWPVKEVKPMIGAAKLGLFYLFSRLGRFSEENLYQQLMKSFVRNTAMEKTRFRSVFYDGKFHKAGYARKFQKMLARLDNRYTQDNMDALANIQVPIHLIWGLDDPFQPWERAGETLKQAFKQTSVTVSKIERCGHFLQLDAPEEYLSRLLD